MIDYILIIYVLMYLLLTIGFWKESYTVLSLSSMGVIIASIYTIIYGIGTINDFLTKSFGMVSLGIGIYVMIRSAIQIMEIEKIFEW